MSTNKRITKDEYFMKIVEAVSLRSTCVRHNIGCVIEKDDKVISTGYNGAVRKSKHCIDIGCIRDKLEIPSGTQIETCSGVHAEQNAMIQAGKMSENASLYVNASPCITCAKMIVNSCINKVVVPLNDNYPDKKGLKLLRDCGIEIVEVNI